jgi:hypothetical protein
MMPLKATSPVRKLPPLVGCGLEELHPRCYIYLGGGLLKWEAERLVARSVSKLVPVNRTMIEVVPRLLEHPVPF